MANNKRPTRSEEWRNKIRESCKGTNRDSEHGLWKGDNVGHSALHGWVKRRLPKPELCEICNIKPAMDLANKSGSYIRNLDDWYWLCRSCHMQSDGRILNLRNGRLTEKYRCEKILEELKRAAVNTKLF